MRRCSLRGLALAAALLALAADTARATTVAALDFEALVERAEAVVHATCLDVRTERSAAGRIQTRVTFAVHRAAKGPKAPRLELVLPGGVRAGAALVIHGMPRFQPGEEVVLLATASHPRTGVRLPVGLAQGLYRVTQTPAGEKIARRDTRGLHMVDVTGGRARPVPGSLEALPLDDLLSRVAAEVDRQRANSGGD